MCEITSRIRRSRAAATVSPNTARLSEEAFRRSATARLVNSTFMRAETIRTPPQHRDRLLSRLFQPRLSPEAHHRWRDILRGAESRSLPESRLAQPVLIQAKFRPARAI